MLVKLACFRRPNGACHSSDDQGRSFDRACHLYGKLNPRDVAIKIALPKYYRIATTLDKYIQTIFSHVEMPVFEITPLSVSTQHFVVTYGAAWGFCSKVQN